MRPRVHIYKDQNYIHVPKMFLSSLFHNFPCKMTGFKIEANVIIEIKIEVDFVKDLL